MSFSSLLVQSVTILRAGVIVDRYGSSIPDWDNPSEASSRAWIAHRESTEDNDEGRNGRSSDWVAFLPPDATVDALDRVQWNGYTFEVVGLPKPAWSPRGLHHYEVDLRLVQG